MTALPPALGSLVQVRAPSRLHFGLLAFGPGYERQYGGAGVMIDEPALEVDFEPQADFGVDGPWAERIRQFAESWARYYRQTRVPGCRIELRRAPRPHVGFGTGTQLALSVAAGLAAVAGRPRPVAEELARSVMRGRRSAVGTYGFVLGGLIVERGKLAGELLAPLAARVEMPDSWHFVVVCLRGQAGLSGFAEGQAFDELPPVPPEVARRLSQQLFEELLPAARHGDFAAFSECLYQYGRLAGSCFARRQGGPYNGPEVTELIELLRAQGVRGVGQSSWGPAVFAAAASGDEARRVAQYLESSGVTERSELWITRPNRTGARLHIKRACRKL